MDNIAPLVFNTFRYLHEQSSGFLALAQDQRPAPAMLLSGIAPNCQAILGWGVEQSSNVGGPLVRVEARPFVLGGWEMCE